MKKIMTGVLALAAASLLLTNTAMAGPGTKTYQVTGPVVELTDSYITVMKGEEKWQVARDKGAKVTGDLKVGSKVTIQYQMVATDIEVKGDKAEKKSDKKK